LKSELTQSQLIELLDYNSGTGEFRWIVSRRGTRKNKMAGSFDAYGYQRITIGGRSYKSHRLAWLYVYGECPSETIDHINHIRNDNRIENLRDVEISDNFKNRSFSSRNSSGCTGVLWHKNRWCVQITEGGKQYHLGVFRDLSKAVLARKLKERELNFHRNHGIGSVATA